MKKLYSLVMTALAMFSVGTQTSYADETVLTPTQTTVIQADGKTAQNANTVLYNAEATSWRYSYAEINGGAFRNKLATWDGTPVVLTKFDASTTLDGKLLKKATLSFSTVCTVSKQSSIVQVATINTGWDATTATWTNTNTAKILNAVGINNSTDEAYRVSTKKTTLTFDVTSYLQASTDNTLGIALFTATGREQEASDLKLTLEYVDAASASNYTVKYVDAAGNEIKTSSTYAAEKGLVPPLTESDKDAIYNKDKTVKYVYDSDDAASLTIAADGSTVVTIKFREAAKWNYTFNAVDEEGNPLQEGIVKGTNFEGETFDVGYPYAINVDGTLYTSNKLSSDRKGYYLSYTLKADNQVKNITFKPTTTTDIVFLSEAENIEGLTKATNNNTFVRSSNGGSAYAAEADVEITKLQPGKYKLIAVICNPIGTSEWNFLAGDNNIFKFKVGKASNWTQGTSEEFEVNTETPIYLAKGGSANQAVDFIYIQRTGDATETVSVSNAGYATYATTNNIEVPESNDVKVMTVTVNKGNSTITLNEIPANTVIPAGTGILVKAAQGNHDFVVTSKEGAPLKNNSLVAATTDVTSYGDKFFALTKQGEKVGFALVANGVVIPASKAYLEVPEATAAKFFGLDGEATGINNVKTAKADGAYYTLEGVKTTKPVKGLYIHNGKKIVVK